MSYCSKISCQGLCLAEWVSAIKPQSLQFYRHSRYSHGDGPLWWIREVPAGIVRWPAWWHALDAQVWDVPGLVFLKTFCGLSLLGFWSHVASVRLRLEMLVTNFSRRDVVPILDMLLGSKYWAAFGAWALRMYLPSLSEASDKRRQGTFGRYLPL